MGDGQASDGKVGKAYTVGIYSPGKALVVKVIKRHVCEAIGG